MKRAIRFFALLYFCFLLALWGFLCFDTGALWPVTLFLFSPRWVVAIPLFLLIPLTLVYHLRLTFAYALHGMVIAFPIMGCRLSWTSLDDAPAGQPLRVMTCNVGGGFVRYEQLAALAKWNEVQVLMLQECSPSMSKSVFEKLGWSHREAGNIAVGSCFELGEMRILARQPPSHYEVVAAVSCELRRPTGLRSVDGDEQPATARVNIVSVHLPTFRPALEEARNFNADTGAHIDEMGAKYRQIAGDLLRNLQECENSTVIGGDFNVPVESAYYRDYWSNYTNALSCAGNGLAYTKYTRLHGIRIDHVLVDSHWNVCSASVGPDLGGDHRPVIVQLAAIR